MMNIWSTYRTWISIGILWLFHLSAVIGIALGYERWFIDLSPLNLSMCLGLLLLNMPVRLFAALLIPFAAGMVSEWLGVHWGWIYGSYAYGDALGWKWFEVPLVIGVNWALLVYATYAVVYHERWPRWLRWIAGACLMVILDILMEQQAPQLDYWEFVGGVVPLQNYIGWFAVGFLAHVGFDVLHKQEPPCLPFGRHLYALFFLFFLFLNWMH
jgi:bisanhydrobacterioruberin hydratase